MRPFFIAQKAKLCTARLHWQRYCQSSPVICDMLHKPLSTVHTHHLTNSGNRVVAPPACRDIDEMLRMITEQTVLFPGGGARATSSKSELGTRCAHPCG